MIIRHTLLNVNINNIYKVGEFEKIKPYQNIFEKKIENHGDLKNGYRRSYTTY